MGAEGAIKVNVDVDEAVKKLTILVASIRSAEVRVQELEHRLSTVNESIARAETDMPSPKSGKKK